MVSSDVLSCVNTESPDCNVFDRCRRNREVLVLKAYSSDRRAVKPPRLSKQLDEQYQTLSQKVQVQLVYMEVCTGRVTLQVVYLVLQNASECTQYSSQLKDLSTSRLGILHCWNKCEPKHLSEMFLSFLLTQLCRAWKNVFKVALWLGGRCRCNKTRCWQLFSPPPLEKAASLHVPPEKSNANSNGGGCTK